jgi:hypothetical protein
MTNPEANPKPEFRKPKQIRNTNSEVRRLAETGEVASVSLSELRILNFGLHSSFHQAFLRNPKTLTFWGPAWFVSRIKYSSL